jgi:hypothetical protein
MNDLLSLLEQPEVPQRYARGSDPDTSHTAGEAAREFEGFEGRRVMATLIELEHRGADGATAHDIVMRLAYSGHAPQQNCVARRFTTLHKNGHVIDTGLRRKANRRGAQPGIVWASTESGRLWFTEGET